MTDDIVTRLRQEHVAGWVHSAGECATCDAADEIERLRAAGDALAKGVATYCGDEAWADRALRAWEEARRG